MTALEGKGMATDTAPPTAFAAGQGRPRRGRARIPPRAHDSDGGGPGLVMALPRAGPSWRCCVRLHACLDPCALRYGGRHTRKGPRLWRRITSPVRGAVQRATDARASASIWAAPDLHYCAQGGIMVAWKCRHSHPPYTVIGAAFQFHILPGHAPSLHSDYSSRSTCPGTSVPGLCCAGAPTLRECAPWMSPKPRIARRIYMGCSFQKRRITA